MYIVDVIRYPYYKFYLCTFWHYHPYFTLQFYSTVFILVHWLGLGHSNMIHCSPFIRKPSGPDITYERRCRWSCTTYNSNYLDRIHANDLHVACGWWNYSWALQNLHFITIFTPTSLLLFIHSFLRHSSNGNMLSFILYWNISYMWHGLDGTVYFTCLRQADQNSKCQILLSGSGRSSSWSPLRLT